MGTIIADFWRQTGWYLSRVVTARMVAKEERRDRRKSERVKGNRLSGTARSKRKAKSKPKKAGCITWELFLCKIYFRRWQDQHIGIEFGGVRGRFTSFCGDCEILNSSHMEPSPMISEPFLDHRFRRSLTQWRNYWNDDWSADDKMPPSCFI